MKNIFKIAVGTLAIAATVASAATAYPFPQNRKSPNGYTIPFADPSIIKEHFNLWKGAWYDASRGWVLAPEGTESTVSEAIAYGMLITVYMDDGTSSEYKTMFDKLYGTWKTNAAGSNGGMNWKLPGGSGTASDADFDAALALVMAYKQWGDQSYLNDAKAMIDWIAQNDISSNKIRPGNQWNDAFNPSYAATASFQLFQDVAGGSWTNVISQAYTDLNACQDGVSGLVPDWCDWNNHSWRKTSAVVAQDEDPGFFDDAARTPWRMAWAYYWYGDTKAQAFNKKITDWMLSETHSASEINSGYYPGGKAVLTEKRNFVSSTFSGGMGMAASSVDSDAAKSYMESVYNVLVSLKSCKTASGCGGSVPGEKYYPSTLNLLYLLLITGNMPNLYAIDNFTPFTPDPSLASSIKMPLGTQQAKDDTTVGVSGYWNWGAYHDRLGIGTEMYPDSGSSPLYLYNGTITAEASMKIGPEPEWTAEAAAAGTLKYPSAGIAMSFKADESPVDFSALGIKKVRIVVKVDGPIRFALLNGATSEAGGEPGVMLDACSEYTEYVFNVDLNDFEEPDWVSANIEEGPMLQNMTGVKFEVKEKKGGIGNISVKTLEFLDASGNVVAPEMLTGIVVPQGIAKSVAVSMAKVSVSGMDISIDGAKAGTQIAVFSMQGKLVASGKATFGNASVSVPSKGIYMVRVGGKLSKVNVK